MDLNNLKDSQANPYVGLRSNVKAPKYQLSNPKYLEDLRSSIHNMNRERYYRNPATREDNSKRLDKLRSRYEFGEKESFVEGDNPYGREALLKHQMQDMNGMRNIRDVQEGRGEFGMVKEARREYGEKFDNLLAKKLKYNNYSKFDFNDLRYSSAQSKPKRRASSLGRRHRAAGNFGRGRSEKLDLFDKDEDSNDYHRKKGFRIIGGRVRRGEGGNFMNDSVDEMNSKSFNYHDLIKKKKKKILNFTRLPVAKKPPDSMNHILNYDMKGFKNILSKRENDREHLRSKIKKARLDETYNKIRKKNKGERNLLKYSSYDNMFQDYKKKKEVEKKMKKLLYNLKKFKLPSNEIENMEGVAGLSSVKSQRPDLRYFYLKPTKFDNIINSNLVNIQNGGDDFEGIIPGDVNLK